MKKQSFIKALSAAAVIALPLAGAAVSPAIATELHQTLTAIKAGNLSPSASYVTDVIQVADQAQAIVLKNASA